MKSGSGDLAPNLSAEELSQWVEITREKYQDRLKGVLTKIKVELERFSWFCSKIYTLEDGVCAVGVSRDASHLTPDGDPDDQDVEVVVQMMSSDKGDQVRGGVGFNVNVLSYGGEHVGGLQSFLYTESMWVPIVDEVQVEARMVLLEKTEPYELVRLLRKWQKGRVPR